MIFLKDFPKPVAKDTWLRRDLERFLAKRERDRQAPLFCDGMIRYH
jgi:hypothetical protein